MVTPNYEDVLMTFVGDELLADRNDVHVDPDTQLLGGAVNSLGMMRLMMFIERDLGITVPLLDVTAENFESISVLANFLRGQSVQRKVS